MKAFDRSLVGRLDLVGAVEGEIASTRNLVPEQPGLAVLANRVMEYADWLASQLLAGLSVPESTIVYARKHGHGVRPVPIASIAGRVVFRALVKVILGDRSPVDRSPEVYLDFIRAPVDYAHEKAGGGVGWLVGDSGITHVVKTDITAFYQYIDHSILQQELLSISADFDAISALMELLSEMEGRAFGLPQLLDPSDDLSDIYADVMERAMIREAFPTWRFNDDFRVACESYTNALAAIEALGRHAADLGLVISELKTFTPRYIKYVFDTLGLKVDQPIAEGTDALPEDAVADYFAPDPAAQLEDAISTLGSIAEPNGSPPEGQLDLLNLRGDGFRRIRRAFRVLTREADPGGLSMH